MSDETTDWLNQYLGLQEATPMVSTYSGPMRATGTGLTGRTMKQHQANYGELFTTNATSSDEFINQYGSRGRTSTPFNNYIADIANTVSGFGNVNISVKDYIQHRGVKGTQLGAKLQELVDAGILDPDKWMSDYKTYTFDTLQFAARTQAATNNVWRAWQERAKQSYDIALAAENNRLKNDYEASKAVWEPALNISNELLQTDFTNERWAADAAAFGDILKDKDTATRVYGPELVSIMESLTGQYNTYKDEIEKIRVANVNSASEAAEANTQRQILLDATNAAANISQNALDTYLQGQGTIQQTQNAATFSGFGRSRTGQMQAAGQAAGGLDAATKSGVAIKGQEAFTRQMDTLVKMAPEAQDNVLKAIGIELGDDTDANKTAVTSLLNNVENALREANLTAGAEVDNVNNQLAEIKNILAREQLGRADAMQSLMMILGVASFLTSLGAGAAGG